MKMLLVEVEEEMNICDRQQRKVEKQNSIVVLCCMLFYRCCWRNLTTNINDDLKKKLLWKIQLSTFGGPSLDTKSETQASYGTG